MNEFVQIGNRIIRTSMILSVNKRPCIFDDKEMTIQIDLCFADQGIAGYYFTSTSDPDQFPTEAKEFVDASEFYEDWRLLVTTERQGLVAPKG